MSREALRATTHIIGQARHHSNESVIRKVRALSTGSIEEFKHEAFEPRKPCLFPAGAFGNIPAAKKWFSESTQDPEFTNINQSYLKPYRDILLPIEYTSHKSEGDVAFHRGPAPFGLFLSWLDFAGSPALALQNADLLARSRLYVAQAPLTNLPRELQADLPMPDHVRVAGKGDVYDSSIWIGLAPTYTPLHKDPNPNVFVQLVGRKKVRIMEPGVGEHILRTVRSKLQPSGFDTQSTIRGSEMMEGEERHVLHEAVWDTASEQLENVWEAELGSGDGIYLPSGWWHSFKGIGAGVVGSVNWWFR